MNPKIDIFPHVYKPQTDSFLLLDYIYPSSKDVVLELCTGCGIIALHLAQTAFKVYATDINPHAIANAKHNARINGMENIYIQHGNLYDPVKDHCFDLIVANPPYVPTPPDWQPEDIIETAWNAGPNGRMIIDHIIKELPRYLKPNGRFIMVQSSLSNIPKTQNQLIALGFHPRILAKKYLPLGPISRARYHWLKTHAPIIHPNTELLVILETRRCG